mmetsp:Transcript_44395/g.115385  ORF Transcript_44395/g.115385 Transcript_44395/m.115385 type:complete len:258 (-) Transcript_44395:201-974(-)
MLSLSHFQLAQLNYMQALSHFDLDNPKECLKEAPCKDTEALEDVESAINRVSEMSGRVEGELLLLKAKIFMKLKQYKDALVTAKAAKKMNSRLTAEASSIAGDCYMDWEEYEYAVNEYKAAHEADSGNRIYSDKLHRAEMELRKAKKKKDYYKVLGLRRGASLQEIKKAYRTLAVKYHPDKQVNEHDRTRAVKKFRDIAEAYEILKDPEKKRRIDQEGPASDESEELQPFTLYLFFFVSAGVLFLLSTIVCNSRMKT